MPNPSFPKGRLHPPHPLQGGVDTLTRVRGEWRWGKQLIITYTQRRKGAEIKEKLSDLATLRSKTKEKWQ